MAYELSLRVDSERVGVYSCDQNDEYIEKLLPLIDKYNAGGLVEEDKEFIREIFDEISDNDNEWYDANTIRELYVDDESYDVDDVEINDNDSVANNIDSDYCIVSYFKWRNQTLSGEIDTEDFDIDLLSVECVKTIFTQGHSFNSSDGIKYNGEPVYCEESAGKSDTFHLKIYKKDGDSYIKLADFNFDKLDSNQTNTNQEPKTLLEYLKHIEVTRIDDDDDETIFFSIDGAHGEMSESDSEQYDLFVHNFKAVISACFDDYDEVWDKISSVKLSNDDMNDLESNWKKNAAKYFGTGDDDTDERLNDDLVNYFVTAAWLTSRDIDYAERWENEDLEDLYDYEYRYCVSIDGSYVFNCEMDIDLT